MAGDRTPNRWLIAVAAVIMQICLGAVYGWSVFVHPLMGLNHWTLTEVSLTFTIAIAMLGVGTVIGGLWQDRVGPRIVASVAGILYGLGFLVSAWAVSQGWLMGLYLGYGVLGGVGMGMGYICPVATITKWFPDRRGLMTGVAVMGYGAGALVMSPIAAREISERLARDVRDFRYRLTHPGGCDSAVLRESSGRVEASGVGTEHGRVAGGEHSRLHSPRGDEHVAILVAVGDAVPQCVG